MKYGYFDSKELASKDGSQSPFGDMHVKTELLVLLNAIRGAFGGAILVNSAYRSPAHNKAIGGVDNSYHCQGLACDIRPSNPSALDELYLLCDKLNPSGGVGRYNTFVHVDCRGSKARWDNRTK